MQAYADKSVFVTGATGFIGQHLVEALVKAGAKVGILVRSSSRPWAFPDRIAGLDVRWWSGDVCDSVAVRRAIQQAKPEIVFSLAAKHSVDMSYYEVGEHWRVNCIGVLNLAEVILECAPEARIVQLSSSEVYGNHARGSLRETHECIPVSPYAASKLAAEGVLSGLYGASAGKLNYGILRAFNVYGPNQSTRAIIPKVIEQALRGNEVKIGTLETARDWTYVTDTVAALLAMGVATDLRGPMNVSSGCTHNISEVVSEVAKVLQRPLIPSLDYKQERPKEGEIFWLCGASELARHSLNWEPKVSWEDGIRTTVKAFQDGTI